MITADELRSLLDYDPETGVFIWRERPWLRGKASTFNTKFAGKRAGVVSHDGYRKIRLHCGLYYEHRLVWLYVYGVWPGDTVDHENLDTSDNRIRNLRDATESQNGANRGAQVNSSTGLKGAFTFRNKFRSQIKAGGKLFHLGVFETAEKAHKAYAAAAEKHFGRFARTA